MGLPPFILASGRFAVMFAFLIPLLLSAKSKKILESKNIRLQITRAFITFSVLILTYTGYRYLPLGIAAAISTSEPLFVILWSFILQKENLESASYLVPIVFLGFMGMLLINSQNLVAMSISSNQLIGLVSLICANIVCSGGHYLSAKLSKIDHTITTLSYGVLFNSALVLLVITACGSFGYSFDIKTLQPNILIILTLAASAWIGSWIGLEMFKYIDPNTNSSIQNLVLPISMVVGYFVERETITFLQLIGIGTIFISTLLLSYRKFNINKLDTRYEIKKPKLMRYIQFDYILVIIALIVNKFLIKNNSHVHHHVHHAHNHAEHDHSLCG